MQKEHVLVNEIVTNHRERMLNLKKYYPFFKLSEISFSWFMEGKYQDILDMGYILMAVLRFFIEENNFREKDVTYKEYVNFMESCIKRDFGIILDEPDRRVLIDYVFDKLKNDGRPFSFEYYDPVDRVKKISRVKLLESRIEDGTVWYSISPDGIEFYLDTKEIRDSSRISVEQLLLEKMIQSEDFKGGTQVVKKINEEVKRLWNKKDRVMQLLSTDVFAGIEGYRDFFDTGIKWFAEEQKLFIKNRELIEAALKRAESEKILADTGQFYRTVSEIYRLDTELKIAMDNHSRLLRACTDLGIKADEILRESKLRKLRSRFDFKSCMDTIIKSDQPEMMELIIHPFLGLNIRKTFDLSKTEDILCYRPGVKEEAEIIENHRMEEIIFEDELAETRFKKNSRTLLLVMLQELCSRKSMKLLEYNEVLKDIFSESIFKNGDYYTFLIHLCEKNEYILGSDDNTEGTFLDAMIKEYMKEAEFDKFKDMRFCIELAGGNEEEIRLGDNYTVTDFTIRLE